MASSSDVIVRLHLQGQQVFVSGAKTAADSVENIGDQADKASSKTDAFKGAMGKLGGALKVGALGLSAAGAAATAMGVSYDASMEQTRVAFKQFLGSGKAADTMITNLQKLNKATPFEFPELAGTTKRLLAMGFNAKDATEQTKTLADAVAGIGGGGAELDRASLAIGQIASKGKLSAEDLMQLTELGVVGMKDLAKQFNMSGGEFAKAMSQGKISSDEALTAINKVTKSNFGGAAAAQSKTFAGQLSNLKDSASQLMGEAMLPLFEYLRTTAMPALANAMPTIKTIAILFGKTLIGAIKGVTTAVGYFVDHWNTIKTIAIILTPLVAGLVTLGTTIWAIEKATKAWAVVQGALNIVMAANPIVLVIAGIVALVAAVVIAYKKFDWFRNAVNNVWAALKTAFNWVKTNWPKLAAILAGPFGIAVLLIARNWDKIKDGARAVLGWFKSFGGRLMEGIASGIKSAGHLLLDALRFVIDQLPIPGVLKGKLKDVLGFASGGVMPHTGLAVVGERGPELLQLPGGSRITPLPAAPSLAGAGGGLVQTTANFYLDRRLIATAVAEDTSDRKARR